ncbi:tol-pal system YbgF family protein [Lacinutrix sp. Hel_I_90]|uniref:tetratricopeptide repeat protein n=1 Tax=Lacinutrix sp. Hel_I_90 TaxID=1249999 RepID=UPI0005CB4ED1|nr:tetratricopeptide repeat protein [Lacinutrix sp. Hel_I_90]
MNFSDDILQRIEDYFNGDLRAEQLKAFEKQIKENPDLAETVAINKKMRLQYGDATWDFIADDKRNDEANALESLLISKEFQDKKKAIKNAGDLYFKNEKSKSITSIRPKLYFALAIAAALVVFFGIFLKDNALTSEAIYVENSNWDELPSLVSRGETNAMLLSTGENAFTNKDYKLAEKSFSTYIKNEKDFNVNALLYLGIAQLELENYTSALESFQKIIDSKTLDHSKGYWYKALVYFKRNDKANAIKNLEIIAANPEYYKHVKAKAILEAMQ